MIYRRSPMMMNENAIDFDANVDDHVHVNEIVNESENHDDDYYFLLLMMMVVCVNDADDDHCHMSENENVMNDALLRDESEDEKRQANPRC
jgi:hypothetical protein